MDAGTMANLDKMSKEDLAKEREEAEARLKEIRKAESEYDGRRLKELKAEIEQMLAAEGYSLGDITDGRQKPRRAGGGASKAAAKYRHPENPSITWSGRGRQPGWFKAALESGAKKEDLAV
jgi:DNA-binding protein H-NS